MKRVLYSMLVLAGLCVMNACSNGDYSANPSSNVNGAVNPITPLTSAEFTWSGEAPLSADIDGSHWKASAASWALDDSGANILIATGGGKTMYFKLLDVWTGNLYDMQYDNKKRFSYYMDSANTGGVYFSNLDNSGEIKIVQNDSSIIKGLFYYKGHNGNGKEVSIKNGYFKINKF